jgi:hypothetical protein
MSVGRWHSKVRETAGLLFSRTVRLGNFQSQASSCAGGCNHTDAAPPEREMSS